MIVLAAPQYFERAGAGVSSLPLQVTAFTNPNFGDIADAVNLATGNVYLDLSSVNRNNLMASTDDTKNTFGNFHVNGIARLAGFNTSNPTQPAEWSVAVGDGGFQTYQRVSPNGSAARCVDNRSDLFGIAKLATGSSTTEVHVMNGKDNYKTFIQNTPTSLGYDNTNNVYRFADWDHDSIPDLFIIKRGPTGTNKTELHILSGASNYKTYLVQTGTVLGLTDANWDFQVTDYNSDGIPDLVGMPRQNTGTRSTEIHVLNGATSFQTFITQLGTAFPNLDPATTSFHFADWDGDGRPDLIGIYSATGTNKTEVHIASAASNYKTFIFERTTALGVVGANWEFSVSDYDKDGRPDIFAVVKNATSTNRTEVHVLNGSTEFQSYLTQTPTGLETVGNTNWSIQAADYAANCEAKGYDFATAPSWISDRYAAIRNGVNYYVTKPTTPGVQAEENWLVTYILPNGRNVAHLYDHSGNRTTFYSDGEYADFTQSLSEQYRGAKYNADSEGGAVGTPKTEYTYTGMNNGHLTKVKDAWGRVTTYEWDEANGTLLAVRMMLQNENDSSSAARFIEYTYEVLNGQRVVTYIAFRTYDGQKNLIGRWVDLNYKSGANGAVLLSEVNRSSLSANYDGGVHNTLTTVYSYDEKNRVDKVVETGVPDTIFTYGTSSVAEAAGGLQLIKTQGTGVDLPAKVEIFNFTPEGWLRNRKVRISNNTDEDYNSPTTYWYDSSGHLVVDSKPGDSQMQYIYDAHGNQVTATSYKVGVAYNSSIVPEGYERSVVSIYNKDNQITSTTDEGRAGTVDGDANYNYKTLSKSFSYIYNIATTSSQSFKSVSFTNNETWVNNKWNGIRSTYDEYGRLTRQTRDAMNETSRIDTYSYKDGTFSNQVVYANTNGDWNISEATRSYGDQVSVAVLGGVEHQYNYNPYGDIVWQVDLNAFVGKWTTGTASTRMREIISTYNGFGQKTYEYVVTNDGAGKDYVAESRKYWQYYSTGELNWSWSGNPSNVTDYRYYDASGSRDVGRVSSIVKGIGADGTVTTPHATTSLTYDDFGRVATSTSDGFTTRNQYDTVDRIVKTTLPDTTTQRTWYDVTGGVRVVQLVDVTGRTDTTVTKFDSLGRPTLVTYPDNGTVSTFYDPFDRPIKVVDNRLTMNTAGNDRATYMVYDELGNLIKKLGPAISTDANVGGYVDGRRPYAEYSYDNFGRQTGDTTLLYGATITPANMAFPAGVTTAVNRTQYDIFDRPIQSADSSGYVTDTTYDNDGNAVKVTRQAWNGTESNYTTASPGFLTTTTYVAFNGVQKPTQMVDGRGNSRKAYYDTLGNVTMQVDQNNVVTKINSYLQDGLLDSVWEPKLDGTTGPTDGSFAYGDYSNFVATEQYLYEAGRVHPSTLNRAIMNRQAGGSPNSTQLTYDYAGRLLTTVLPLDQAGVSATITRSYDTQGNIRSETDQNGFTTTSTYDWAGHKLTRDELGRPGNAVDQNAGLAGGLHSDYAYDLMGNLKRKNEHGLYVNYSYNSLGKVTKENQPNIRLYGNGYAQIKTYRLDGLKTAQTSYDYTGNLTLKPDIVVAGDPSITVTSGNITLMEYTARGDQSAEVSFGPNRAQESAWWQWYNGTGLRYQRVFTGGAGIYAQQRTAAGLNLGHANYMTYWRMDPNGNLIEKWDTPMDGWNWTPRDANDKQNAFTYSYTPTNKEYNQSRNVQVRVQSTSTGNTLWSEGGNNGVLLAATVTNSTSSYSARDQLAQLTVTDYSPVIGSGSTKQSGYGNSQTKSSSFSYYPDGRQSQATTDKGTRTTTYDNRGREINVTAPEGVTSTIYRADGSQSVSVIKGGATVYSNIRSVTVAGLEASNSEGPSASMYNTLGQNITKTIGSNGTQTNSYDDYGQLLSTTQPFYDSETRSYLTQTVYQASYDLGGNTTSETKSGSQVTYTLDSKGHRLAISGGSLNGSIKRYNAEGQAAQFYILAGPTFVGPFGNNASGNANKYNDFRYDPQGKQILTSVAGIAEGNRNNEYEVDRDTNNIILNNGSSVYVFRRAGKYKHEYRNAGYVYYSDTDTYTPNQVLQKDSTYSMAVGYNDNTAWTGVTPFAVPRRPTQALQAPVVPLSSKLRVNPASVTAGSVTTRLPDPGKVTTGSTQPVRDVTPPTTTGPATPGGTSASGPALAGTVNAQSASTSIGNLTSVDPAKVTQAQPALSEPTSTAKVAVYSAEVGLDFNDGTGFKHSIYAQDVRTLGLLEDVKALCRRIADYGAKLQAENDKAVQQIKEDNDALANKLVANVTSKWGTDAGDAMASINHLTGDDNPLIRKAYLQTLAQGILDGKINEKEFIDISCKAHLALTASGSERAVAIIQAYAGPFVQVYGGEVASMLLDFMPIIGSLKSAAETLLGENAVTGEKSSWLDRAFSAVGVLPELGALVKNAGKIGKYGKEFRSFLDMMKVDSKVVKRLESQLDDFGGACKINSFSRDTLVRTISGLVAIGSLTLGTPVLAFNEQTNQNGYYPITDIISHGTKGQGVTFLTITDPEQGNKSEYLTTTPEHPFYIQAQADAQARPKPVGHEELSSHWVGAGHLQVGDKVKQADGSTGTVSNVFTFQQTQEMFNLTVDTAHTFYVGSQGWLVHNATNPIRSEIPLPQQHHIYPQQFQNYFDSRGIDINDHTVDLHGGAEHQRGIHGKGGVIGPNNTFLPGRYNDRWADFINDNPNASKAEVEKFASKMKKTYGLENLQEYRYRGC
jgi:YD repeat-containing protein